MLKNAEYLETEIKNKGKLDILRGKLIGLLFCEASTRTQSSFAAAAMKLGADVINLDWDNSSAKKGETMQDTLRTLEGFCDGIVMRHPEKGIHSKMQPYLSKPIINAGDGAGEHPTQALLDMYTIYRELGRNDNLNITLLGDLKNGRTVHSLSWLLSRFNNIMLNFVSPDALRIPEEITNEISADRGDNAKMTFTSELTDDIIKQTDVLYVTRLQRERFAKEEDYFNIKSGYNVSKDTIRNAKEKMIIMHPLPRVDELNEDLDNDPRSAWFRQVAYGVFMRAAILEAVFNKN